ncbi:lactate 2-monooxygenase [Bacillus piscicola]|uniref:lactate 2-monooxygenase n=1 Tax=Bacillus piscicola TaxID=1632684 RepID=UPI001F091BB4|nr:lactate 2-monooxygenase [Bacillus piscicola]
MFKSGNEVQQEMYQGMFSPEKERLPVSYEEWEKEARKKLEDGPFDYVAGGAGSEQTVRSNRSAFERWQIVPRMLQDVSDRDLSVSLFGETFASPLMLAPIGVQSIIHPDGELASAKAASTVGIPFTASTLSTNPMEAIASAAGDSPKWYQLYWNEDNDMNASLLKRAEQAGYSAIVVTLDTTLVAWRERDLRNAYLPFLLGEGIGNYLHDPVFCSKLEKVPYEDMEAAINAYLKVFGNTRVTWDDIDFLRKHTSLPIILKGILHPEDARLALHHGVDGIVVSNHGGRQVDGSVPAIDALPRVAEVVRGRIPVLMDSGIRRGADVLKALALGADSVMIGRPFVYGLAVAGEKGVEQVIRNLIADIDLTLALSGKKSIGEIDRSLIVEA